MFFWYTYRLETYHARCVPSHVGLVVWELFYASGLKPRRRPKTSVSKPTTRLTPTLLLLSRPLKYHGQASANMLALSQHLTLFSLLGFLSFFAISFPVVSANNLGPGGHLHQMRKVAHRAPNPAPQGLQGRAEGSSSSNTPPPSVTPKPPASSSSKPAQVTTTTSSAQKPTTTKQPATTTTHAVAQAPPPDTTSSSQQPVQQTPSSSSTPVTS